jgi:hypothetical protein
MDLVAGCGTIGDPMRGLLLSALVAGVLALASRADAQVFKPRTGTAAAPVKKPAKAAPAHHATKKRGKKKADDEDTVVVDDNDKDTDDVKVKDD